MTLSSASTLIQCIFYITSLYNISINAVTYYQVTSRTGSYRKVRGLCTKQGGDLATYHSFSNVQKIYKLCQDAQDEEESSHPWGFYWGKGCYVGFNRIRKQRGWTWVDGTAYDGYDYATASSYELGFANQLCGAVYLYNEADRSMDNVGCNSAWYGICEFSTDICSCFGVTLLSESVNSGNVCYQYRADFCNDVDIVRLGMGTADRDCGFDLESAFVSIQSSRRRGVGVSLITNGPPSGRGIEISGLQDGDTFTLCFDEGQVGGTDPGGVIEFDDGEDMDECVIEGVVPNFCPDVSAKIGDDGVFIVNMEGMDTVKGINRVNVEPMTLMQFVWVGIISAVVSIIVVVSAYILCIKPANKGHVYDKLVLDEK